MSLSGPVPSVARQMTAELLGTFMLVFFGCGVVHTAVLTGAQQGIWQVAIVWGIAVMLAIYSVGGVSGAHLNPAVTVAMAVWRGFPMSRVLPYAISQVTGGFLAAMILFFLFSPQLLLKERIKGVVRGEPGSEVTAMCYGEYFPNPGSLAAADTPYSHAQHAQLRELVSHRIAFLAEVCGTAILGLVIFAVTDDRNLSRPPIGQPPIMIGMTVASLISVIGPLTQACFNPARDFGPRLFAAMAGWGKIALPGTGDLGWLTVYIIAPTIGAVLGGGIYQFAVRPAFLTKERL